MRKARLLEYYKIFFTLSASSVLLLLPLEAEPEDMYIHLSDEKGRSKEGLLSCLLGLHE